jgi:hypothetical protein
MSISAAYFKPALMTVKGGFRFFVEMTEKYSVFSLSGHSSQADPSFKRTIFLRPAIPYAIIN